MDPTRVVVYAVVGCIVVLTLATGPSGPVRVEQPSTGPEDIGTGNATVEVVSTPETITIREGTAGQGLRYIKVPPTTVEVLSLRGNPTLTYTVSIDALGLTSNSVHVLRDQSEGRVTLTIDRRSTDKAVSDLSQVTLRLVLYGETDRTVFQKTVPVEVEG